MASPSYSAEHQHTGEYSAMTLSFDLTTDKTVLVCVSAEHPSKDWSDEKGRAAYQDWYTSAEHWAASMQNGGAKPHIASRYFINYQPPKATLLLVLIFDGEPNGRDYAARYRESDAYKDMIKSLEQKHDMTVLSGAQFLYSGGYHISP